MESIYMIRYKKMCVSQYWSLMKALGRAAILPFLLLLLAVQLQAQSPVNYVEYYVDQDPGLGNATAVTVTSATVITNATFNVNVTALTQGVHILGARARTASGIWGMGHYWFIFKPYGAITPSAASTLTRVEYFIDTDPGLGKATSIAITPGSNDLANTSFNFDPSSLTKGTHIVGVRSLNTSGVWSLTNYWLFYNPYANIPTPAPPANINYVEYFIDTDPGIGKASQVTVTPGVDISNGIISANISSLGTGAHILGARGKDALGNWSVTNNWLFVKPFSNIINATSPNITSVEYYLDYDPGFGKGKSITITPGTDLSNLSFNIDISAIVPGSHYAVIRARDVNGNWSLVNNLPFTIPGTAPVMSTVVSTTTLCAGSQVITGYTVSGLTFNNDNQFIAQLSDASGSFSNPIQIGAVTTTAVTGQFSCTIPASIASGSAYRIRVISTSQVIIADNNGTNITVNAVGLPVISIPAKDTTVCQGNALQFTATNIGGSVQWLFNGTAITAATGSTYSIPAVAGVNAGVYNIKVTGGGGCSLVSNNITIAVNANVPAIPTINPSGNVQVTLGNSVLLTSSSATNNQWLLNNSSIAGATSQTLSVTAAGTYKVRVSNGTCTSESANNTVVTLVIGNGTPLINASRPTTFCSGDSTVLTSSVTTGINQWNLNGTAIAGATGTSYTVKTAGNYTVTASGLTSSAITITVNTLPTATITPSGTTTICSGNSVILTASTGSIYKWFVNDIAITGATNAGYPASIAGNYTVQIINSNGCSATSAIAIVTVGANTVVPIVSNTRPLTFCIGDSTVLTASSASGNQWYRNGIIISGATNISYTVTTAGVYTDTATNANGCKAGSATNTTIVNPLPTVPAITAGGTTIFCNGGSVMLTSSSATGNQWYRDGIAVTNAVNAGYTATTGGIYTDTITNASGCKAGSLATMVTVNASPGTPTISAAGPTTFCGSGNVVLSSSSATNNQWYKEGILIAGATNTTYTANTSGSYTDTVTNAGACKAGSAVTAVLVNAFPAIPTITAGGPTTFCGNGNVVLTSSLATGNQWYKDGVAIANAVNASYTAVTGGIYTDTVRNAGGCKTGSAAITITVHVLPATPTIIAGGITTLCNGASVVLTSSSTTANQWYKDGIAISGATNTIYTANATGVYTDSVINGNGCKSGSSAITVTAVVVATPTISQQGDTLISSAVNGNQWYLNGTIIPGGVNQKHKVLNTGTYTVKATNANGCISALSANFPLVITALNTVSVNNADWKLYPNPVENGIFYIRRTGSNITGNSMAQITTLDGKIVKEKSIGSNSQWNIAELPKGVYYLRIVEKKSTSVYQLIKQ